MFIRSKTRFSDTLTFSSGARKLTLLIDLDLCQALEALQTAGKSLARLPPVQDSAARLDDWAQALRSLFEGLFGPAQAGQLLSFYQDDPAALLEDLLPYLLRRIIPAAVRCSARRRRALERALKRTAGGAKA